MESTIVGYGELLLRLTPSDHGGLIEKSNSLKMAYAGAEANILCDLAQLGHSTQFVSSFPDNPIGRSAKQFMLSHGVDTGHVNYDDGRMGTYYIEHGSSIRATRVTYDRKNSSVSNFKIVKKDWEKILNKTSHLILTGITPALSSTCRKNLDRALEVAKACNVKVVFDLNYRRTLWNQEKAKKSFLSILLSVDYLFGNIGSAYDVFDIPISGTKDFKEIEDATLTSAKALYEYGDFDLIGMTIRQQKSANNHILGGLILDGSKHQFSNPIPCNIIDRLGGGDAYTAAVLHGTIKRWKHDKIVNFATASFAMTQTLNGDINYATEEELSAIARGKTTGHIKR